MKIRKRNFYSFLFYEKKKIIFINYKFLLKQKTMKKLFILVALTVNNNIAPLAEKKEVVNTSKKVAKEKNKKATKKQIDNLTSKIVAEKTIEKKEVVLRGVTSNEKNYLYKFQLDKSIRLTDKQKKSKRTKFRNDLDKFVNRLWNANQKKQNSETIIEKNIIAKEFINWYKENLIVNDFTIKSLTNQKDEQFLKELQDVLTLSKNYLANGKK